jgi:hypothetical protein
MSPLPYIVATSIPKKSAFIKSSPKCILSLFLIDAESVQDQEQPIIISKPSESPYFIVNLVLIYKNVKSNAQPNRKKEVGACNHLIE